MKRYYLILYCFWVSLCLPLSQVLGQGMPTFVHYTVEDGLPTSTIYTTIQDHQGYIWFGTASGLARYDGINFKTYTVREGLTNNDVFHLFEDSQHRLWIISLGEVCYYKAGKFHTVRIAPNLDYQKTNDIIEHSDGSIWLTKGRTIIQLNDALQPAKIFNGNQLGFHIPYTLLENSEGQVEFYTSNYELCTIGKEDNIELTKLPFKKNNHRIRVASKTKAHYFFKERLYKRSVGSQIQNIDLEGIIKDISVLDIKITNKDKLLWIATFNNGVLLFDKKGDEFTFRQQLLADNTIAKVLPDREENIWLASNNNGVFFIPNTLLKTRKQVETINTLPIHSILVDSSQNIWTGLSNNSILKFAPTASGFQQKEYTSKPNTYRIRALQQLQDGRILIGKDIGLGVLEDDEVKNIETASSTKDILITPDGTLILAIHNKTVAYTSDQVNEAITSGRLNLRDTTNALLLKRSTCLAYDEDKSIWIGSPFGLFQYKDGELINYGAKNRLFKQSITDIIIRPNGEKIVSTDGGGVLIFKNNNLSEITNITTNNNLSSNICYDLLLFHDLILVGTPRGLSIIKRKANQPPIISTFNQIDGLSSNEIMSLANYKDRVIVGTNKGINFLGEEQLLMSGESPLLHIENIKIEEQDQPIQDFYGLDYFQNDFKITYVGISYSSLRQLTYRYRMLPNKEWISTSENFARFKTLKPNDYVFEIQAIDKLGNLSEIKQIKFCIDLPWWQKWWFLLIASIATLILIYYTRAYLKQIQHNQQLRLDVEKKNRALQVQLRELERSNDELGQFAHVVSHDLKEPLRTIASFLQLIKRRNKTTLSSESQEYINFAVGGVKRMESIINDLLIYSQINRGPSNTQMVDVSDIVKTVMENLSYELQQKEAIIEMNSRLPHIEGNDFQLVQLFQNLIENSIKYVENGKPPYIQIQTEELEHQWQFSITDNGIGIDAKYHDKIFKIFQRLHNMEEYSGTGIGLAICKKIVLSHNGTIWFTPNQNKTGTTFHFTLQK